MCGLVGYVGHRPALNVVLQGLGRLEYRGYDSAGVAVLDGAGGLAVQRKAGPLANLQVLAAEIARERGCDVDKPRNLAKSVAVE